MSCCSALLVLNLLMPEVHNRKIDRRTDMEERVSEEQPAEVQAPAAQRRDNEGIYNREYTINGHTIHCATHCISYGLLRASHFRNPTGDRLRRSVAAFAPPLHTLCERMWLSARAYSDFARSRFILIPVAFEIAYSLLRALRVRRSCLRFRRAYAVDM